MKTTPRRPICVIAATILPIATFIVLVIVNKYLGVEGFAGIGFAVTLILIFAISVVLSLILSVVSLLRNERLRGLTLVETFIYTVLCLTPFAYQLFSR